MLELETYLQNAPKQLLSKLYSFWFAQEGGLRTNKEISDRLRSHAFDTERLEALFHRFTPLQKVLLGAIYASGDRGATSEELLFSIPETERFLFQETIEEFRRELLIAREEGQQRLFGFSDLWPDLSDLFSSSLHHVEADQFPRIDLDGFAAQHLLRLFALIREGEWRFTRDQAVAKRHQILYEEGLRFAKQIDESAVSEEFDLLINLAFHNRWITRYQEKILLTQEGEKVSRYSLYKMKHALLRGWAQWRLLPLSQLRTLLSTLSTPASPGSWSEFFWIHEGAKKTEFPREEEMNWKQLPLLLRELILLGMVQMSQNREKKVVALSLSSDSRCWCESGDFPLTPEQQGFATPDFEILLPNTTTGEHVWTLHRAATLTSDDRLMKFKLTREKVLDALKKGVKTSEIRALADWIKLPDAPSQHLEEWLSSFEKCRFSRHLLLEVRDRELRRSLLSLPVTEAWVIEELKDYGLLLRDGAEEIFAPILEQYGLTTPPWPPREEVELPKTSPVRYSPPLKGEIDNSWIDAPGKENLRLGELSPAASHFRNLDEAHRERLLRYSISNQKMLQLLLRSNGELKGRQIKMIPDKLEHNPSPTLFGTDHKGEPISISIESIANLKIPT